MGGGALPTVRWEAHLSSSAAIGVNGTHEGGCEEWATSTILWGGPMLASGERV